jgi:hypothetical protein
MKVELKGNNWVADWAHYSAHYWVGQKDQN